MDSPLWHTLSALLGAIVGGGITFLLNRQQFANQLRILQEQHKVEFMAETTARHFLAHKGFTDRSFETLRNHLGGFTDDELRKILVRAGAMRTYREDGSEWWRLLSRMEESIERIYMEGKTPVFNMAKGPIPGERSSRRLRARPPASASPRRATVARPARRQPRAADRHRTAR